MKWFKKYMNIIMFYNNREKVNKRWILIFERILMVFFAQYYIFDSKSFLVLKFQKSEKNKLFFKDD